MTSRARVMSGLLSLLGLVLLVTTSACTHVAPYQRGRLAHPTMTVEDPVSPGEAHQHAVQEGATGGGSAAESGCGCN